MNSNVKKKSQNKYFIFDIQRLKTKTSNIY